MADKKNVILFCIQNYFLTFADRILGMAGQENTFDGFLDFRRADFSFSKKGYGGPYDWERMEKMPDKPQKAQGTIPQEKEV